MNCHLVPANGPSILAKETCPPNGLGFPHERPSCPQRSIFFLAEGLPAARPTRIREALRAALRSAESPAGFLLSLSGDAWAVCCVADQWLLKMRSIFKDVCMRVCVWIGVCLYVSVSVRVCVSACVRVHFCKCVCVGVCVSVCLCPEKGPRAPPPRRGGKGQVGMRFGASSKGF